MKLRGAALFAIAFVAGCSGSPPASTTLTRAQLLDPQTCKSCHAEHYGEWAASMHAHASDDPVFRAMNARGQRETQGGLGPFCVNCHAPMAVREGATHDGLNLDSVDPKLKGVTCFFCHSVDAVQGAHDNPLHLATDGVLRGPISDPVSAPHGTAYSPLHDRDRIDSAALCGSCHDVVSPHGAKIERSYLEWQHSAFAQSPGGTTCGQCHMSASATLHPIADVSGAPARRAHSHAFPAVDVAPDDPDAGGQLALIQAFLDSTVQSALCVRAAAGRAQAEVILDNVAAGHGFPSGAAQDRRFWVELHASADGGELYASGEVPDGGAVSALPDVWLMRDCMADDAGAPVHMFWEAASAQGNELPGLATFDANDPRYYQTHLAQTYPLGGAAFAAMPDEVRARLHLRAIGVDVLDDLVASGDLAAEDARSAQYEIGPELVWTPASATDTFVDTSTGAVVSCVTHNGLNVQASTVAASPSCGP